MKIYLAAITGHVPDNIVRAISAFLDVCYLVRRSEISETTLKSFNATLTKFYHHREIFRTLGVRDDFSLPRQHALSHYHQGIMDFGAPNGICSSITESRHITAVKRPWRRSNHYNALSQMLLINQCLDKLHAARMNFIERGMLMPEKIKPQPVQISKIPALASPADAFHLLDLQTGIPANCDNDGTPLDDGDIQAVEGNVVLARTRSRCYHTSLHMIWLTDWVCNF